MVGLIVAEASLFAVFVVAYLYDLGKSLGGPSPREVLSVPIVGTVCLLSSSATVAVAVRALGPHASHVIVGLVMLTLISVFGWASAQARPRGASSPSPGIGISWTRSR